MKVGYILLFMHVCLLAARQTGEQPNSLCLLLRGCSKKFLSYVLLVIKKKKKKKKGWGITVPGFSSSDSLANEFKSY